MDLMVQCARLPIAGETVLGKGFHQAPGGKGANQAIAAARLGAEVSFVGCVGDDNYGDLSRASFEADFVDVLHLHRVEGKTTGIAMITSDEAGENSIAFASGANESLSIAHINQAETLIAQAALVVCQLESPMETVLHALKLAKRHSVPVMLNPSPAQKIPISTLSLVEILVLNQHEAAILTGTLVKTSEQARQAADLLVANGIKNVVITLGGSGAVVCDHTGNRHFLAPKVKVVDTTGAGDTLVGALAAAWVAGSSIAQAITLAQSAAAFSVTRRGAQASMPRTSELAVFTTNSLIETA